MCGLCVALPLHARVMAPRFPALRLPLRGDAAARCGPLRAAPSDPPPRRRRRPALPRSARRSGNRATSFVGTAEYVSPEVLNNTGVTYASDLWALGCIVYQMLAGRPPFKGASEYLTFQLITNRELEFPENFPAAARDLVEKLLRAEPSERLGAAGLAPLRAHPFFSGVDWAAGARTGGAPALSPVRVQSDEDAALDWELTSLFRSQGAGPVYYEYLPPPNAQQHAQHA